MLAKVRRAMYGKHKHFNKKGENIKKYQMEIIELKNIIIQLENSKRDSSADYIKWKEGPVNL